MKTIQLDRFLTKGADTTPDAGFVAVGIHPSSEVDLVDVGGVELGVGGIVPLSPTGTTRLQAIRRPTGALAFGGVGNRASVDKIEYPGEKLVLQLYERCDVLVPPGPRLPARRLVALDGAALNVTAANALLAFRLPMQGRQHARISFYRDDDTRDCTVQLVGAIHSYQPHSFGDFYVEDPLGPYTWWDGGVAAPVLTVAGISHARTLHVGGQGDDVEAFDELLVFVYGGGAGASDSVHVTGEADGERVRV